MGQRKRNPTAPKGATQPDGILVSLGPADVDGDRQLSVTPLGEVKRIELPVLLGLARKLSEQQLGIERG